MLDLVSALPDAREGVCRLSQVLSGVVSNTRRADARSSAAKNSSPSLTGAGTYLAQARLLSSDDAQLAQESIERLAALIALGPPRSADVHGFTPVTPAAAPGDKDGDAVSDDSGSPNGPGGLDSLPEAQAEQYLIEVYGMLLKCHVPEALGELAALAGAALLGQPQQLPGDGSGGGGSRLEELQRRRSVELRTSVDLYLHREGGPNPALASLEGLLCGQKLGGHAQALLESICQMLLSCVFDPIWRHRDLLAQQQVRELVLSLSSSQLLPACAHMCTRLRALLGRPPGQEAASHAWMLGFVARCFTGLARCMKAMVEFESCEQLWAQLGDTLAASLAATGLLERFSAAAAAVHPGYQSWWPPPPPGSSSMPGGGGGGGGAGGGQRQMGETYLEMCGAVEVFLEGLFHLTWHHTARAEAAAAAGPPPPLLVRDVLAAMEPEGSGSVADMLSRKAGLLLLAPLRLAGNSGQQQQQATQQQAAAAAAAAAAGGAFGPGAGALSGYSLSCPLWPALLSGGFTHGLAADWLAHVVARLDGGEVLMGGGGGEGGFVVSRATPLLHQPGPVDRVELPLLLSVCLAAAAAGGHHYITHAGNSTTTNSNISNSYMGGSSNGNRRRSIERPVGHSASFPSAAAAALQQQYQQQQLPDALPAMTAEERVQWQCAHAERLLRLVVRGLKAMAASQDAELAPFPAIHAAHSCAVALHQLLSEANPSTNGTPRCSGEWAEGSSKTAAAAAAGAAATAAAGGGAAAAADLSARRGTFWPFAPPPPPHTALLLDAFQASLLCYSAFLHPDPDKDPLTLRAVERCSEQLMELCAATGEGLRTGVAALVYASRHGLLPVLEAVLRAAGLACRMESLRALLTAALSSLPALQQLLLSRDGYLFLTLRKLMIACINLACPHPLESSQAPAPPPNSRRSLTLILQQYKSNSNGNNGAYNGNGNGDKYRIPSPNRRSPWPATDSSNGAGDEAKLTSTEGSASASTSASTSARSNNSSRRNSLQGRPLILPLAVELVDTVAMLAARFIEIHEGRVAAAANIRVDAMGNVIIKGFGSAAAAAAGNDDDGIDDGRSSASSSASTASASSSMESRRRSFEREASELLPLAQILPFALKWLAAPAADLVDALAQEVINDDGTGSLYGGGGSDGGSGSDGDGGDSQTLPAPEVRRRMSVEINRSGLATTGVGGGRPTGHRSNVGVVGSLPNNGGLASGGSNSNGKLLPEAVAAAAWTRPGERSAVVLGRCSDALHMLFRLMVTLTDLNRRAPHPDWPALIAGLQPQQLLARAVQVLVHGMHRQQQHAPASAHHHHRGRRSRLAHPVLLSSLLSASVCGVQAGWLGPESFGIPSASAAPADDDDWPPTQQPPAPPTQSIAHSPQQSGPTGAGGGGGGAVGAGGGAAYGPLFSRVRRFTVISANPEGRAYQWAMVGDDERHEGQCILEEEEEEEGAADPGGINDGGCGADHDVRERHRRRQLQKQRQQQQPEAQSKELLGGRNKPPMLLPAAAPGGAWSDLPPLPGPAVVPTRALQVLVSDYGSAADQVLFDLLLRGLANKRPATGTSTAAGGGSSSINSGPAANPSQQQGQGRQQAQQVEGSEPPVFFWTPPSRSLHLRTCSNPCCMNLSGLAEGQLRLASCPRCGGEWYCSRHCQAMHWHTGHRSRCAK